MKTFKKAISLVLVFAMLASFAGMTGYTPSIIASAATPTPDRKTITIGDGFSIEYSTTVYKMRKDLSGYGSVYTDEPYVPNTPIPETYYGIPNAYPGNDLRIKVNNENGYAWRLYFSLNENAYEGSSSNTTNQRYTAGWGYPNNNISTASYTRPASSAENDEYGLMFRYYLNNETEKGFTNVDTVYWRLEYYNTTDGSGTKKYSEAIPISVEFAPSSPATTTGSVVPIDSKSGVKHPGNVVGIDCPTVLYTNGSVFATSSTAIPLDTTVNFTFPTNTKSATLQAVAWDSDSTKYGSAFNINLSNPQVDFAGKTVTTYTGTNDEGAHNPWLVLRLDYTVSTHNTPYDTKTGSVLDTDYTERNSISPNAYAAGYEPHPDVDLLDTVDVKYTQYMCIYVTPLPLYTQTVWQFDVSAQYSGENQSYAGALMMDVSPALATPGVLLYSSVRYGSEGDYRADACATSLWGMSGNFNMSVNRALVWYDAGRQESCGENKGYYTSGQFTKEGPNSSNRTLGSTIYFDPQATSSVDFNWKFDFATSAYGLKENKNAFVGVRWYNSNVTRAGYEMQVCDSTAVGLGGTLNSHSSNDLQDTHAGGATYYYVNDNSSNKVVIEKIGGDNYLTSSSDLTTANATIKYRFHLKNAIDSGAPYWRGVFRADRSTPSYGLFGAMKTNFHLALGFHLDAIEVSRTKQHTTIEQAKSKNFVEAEMDPTWWKEYRLEVIFSYFACGDLLNTADVTGAYLNGAGLDVTGDGVNEALWRTTTTNSTGIETDDPKFKYANPEDLRQAILRTPAYDRGSTITDPNQVGKNAYLVGGKFASAVGENYAVSGVVDPTGRSYTDPNYSGNGINNLTDASLYRYSGAYFYTDDSWKNFATERFYTYNIIEFQNDVYPFITFDYASSGMGYSHVTNPSKKYSAVYMQDVYNEATDRLNTAYNNLELRTLAEFKMRNDKNPSEDYDGDGVADNVTGGNGAWVKDSNGNQIIGYDAIMAYLASLIPTDTYTYYTTVSDANGNGKIDALDTNNDGYIDDLNPRTAQVYDTTQLEALLSQMQSKFHADDTVVDMGLEFEAYIENFLALVEITLKNPVVADNSAWINIFKYINNTLADHLRVPTGIKAVTFIDDIEKLGIGVPTDTDYGAYVLTEEQKTTFNNAINAYSSAVGNVDASSNTYFKVTQDDDKNGIGAQEEINTAIKAFFNALEVNLPSFLINNAGAEAKAVVENPAKFEVYAPNQATNVEKSIYTAESVQALKDAVNAQLNANSYPFLTTKWSTMNATAATIKSWAQLNSVNANGKLFPAKVDTTYLTVALNAAEAALSDGNLKRTITSHTGETVEWNNYSDQSVAELRYVIDQAENINTNQDYTNQLAVDKLTFALWDEYDDNVGMLLTSDWPVAPRTWSYDSNGNPTGYTDDAWGESTFINLFYGDRVAGANGTDEGLKPNIAYYGFLEAEIKGNTIIRTVINEETGEVISTTVIDEYIGTVWNADGSLILNDNGEPAGKRIFENWSSYMDAYTAAVTLFDAQDKTVDQQTAVDDAAKLLYDKRNALKELSLYFPNNTQDFETAKGWYNELSAYVQKTDVTRYGYEWVDILDPEDETKVIGQELVKSDNPLSSVVQSVYIYNGITPEIEAEIESFRAKYASDNSTEDYNSLGAAQTLYNNIKTTLTDPNTGVLYTVKKTNDESLIAGMLDLTGRIDPETQELVGGYIAGTWTVTFDEETGASTGVYATDLLNETQQAELATYLKNAQDKINSKTDATADFGYRVLAPQTDNIFTYVQNYATDLQFAVHMRDKELFAFLDYTYTNNPDLGGQLVNYYYQDGMYTYRLISENIATEIKGQVNTYFGDPKNWPKIYEIQGTTWNRADAEIPESGIDAVVDGYLDYDTETLESWGEYKGENEKICEILDLVASRAYNYYDALTRGLMPAEISHYTWLVDNAFTEVGGIDYVLADASAVSAANEAPFNYDVSVDNVNDATGNPGWYTAGYGVKDVADGKYYLYYNDAEGAATPSWFTEDSRLALDSALDVLEFANYGLGYRDDEGNIGFSSIDELAGYTPADWIFINYGSYLTDFVTTPVWGNYMGYNELKMSVIDASVGTIQSAIDGITNNAYNALHDLTLLPATEAYRDVYNTYLSIKGQHIDDGNWNGDSYSSATTISNVDFTFYNLLNETQLSRIAGMYSELNDDAAPPYGTVLRASYSGFLDKYTQSGEYADQENNPWYSMETYITNFIDAGATITIDQAARVNTYDKTDNITSIMETLVDDYLSELEFDDLDYSNLDAVVKAFLGDNLAKGLADVKTTLQGMGFTVGYNYDGEFYPLSYYTDDSLLQVAGILRYMNVLADGKIIEKIINTDEYQWIGDTFPLPIVFNIDYKGSFYTSTTDQNKIDSSKEEHNSVLLAFLTALNEDLILKGVDTEKLVEQITLGDAIVPQKYDTTQQAWAEYEDALADAKDYRDRAGEYDIRDQVDVIDAATSRLAAAIEALKEIVLADNYAPQMTLKTSVGAVDEFYSKEAYEVALREADSASFTATGEGDNVTYTANPAAGTFFVPNNSGYSLIVYTNELDPRIVINLEDLEQKLADGTNGSTDVMQDAAKKEYISINAVKTSGVTANVIAGTIVPAHNNIAEKLTVEKALAATANQAVEVTNSSEVKGSSAFAILAPRFVEGKATQAAVYTIQARDGSERNVDGGTVYGNPVKQLEFGGAGQEPVDITVLDSNNNIAIYIYYYSLKAADGRDEGINADGTALAAPAIEGTNVPNILLSGEPGFKGVNWRNGVLLQRSFSSSHRVWEYVSEIKKNDKNQYNVNGTQVPVYNDPTFGQLNTGSFYYVLDDEADADIIATYNDAKSSSTTAGCMDYAAATDAKTAMISAINAANATKLSEMKASGRFYNYGDYETDEFGNVLYNGDEPKWINWAQAIGGKVENGDLVFVHVVDRWGNVVNRIIEITNLDENAPEVSSDEAGAVTIDETGGSGLADIQVHNGDFSLGEFKYEVSQSQNVIKLEGEITNKAEVNCASNVLTIVNLVPGKTYLIGAEDKAGNRSTTAVKADAEGHIVLTIDNKIVQTGEDMGLEGNSSAFTLNGTDTIILNSGEESSVINAKLEGNVFANRTIRHYITTKDNVEALKTVYQDGTVEEFTAENATVKDNGDGTLVWTIKRKLAEGEHKYNVYAKVNGKYETYYAVAVINATTRTVKIECTNVGQGATELKFSGSLSFDIANYISKEVPYGAQVTITAKAYTAYEGCEFYYWINNTTDRIINTADVYEFKAVANADYIAQFTNNSTCIDGKKFVVYVNNAKNVIDRFELAEGDDYAVPSGPVLPDYTFKGWSMTKAEVLASDKATVIVEPIYELNASYTVSIAQGSYTATGAGTYTAEANQRAVVTISTSAKDGEGKDFLYWIDADTDEIVSYDRTYSFFCVKDTELAPVYGDASTVKAEPIVRITEVKFNAFSGKASFFAERSVPEEFTILQTGIVVTKTETIGTNEEVFVVGGTSTAAGTSTSTANNGYYSASTSVATGQTVWARAYVIYETADGEILEVYGPVVSYTVD